MLTGVILDSETLGDVDWSSIQQLPIDWQIYDRTQKKDIEKRIQSAEIVLTNKVVLGAQQLKRSTNIRYIGVLATGVNNVDVAHCEHNHIRVRNVSGYGTHSVAQHTLMLMLMLATSVSRYISDVQDGKWQQSKQFCLLDHPISELAGKHLIIVGYGELGRAVAKLAKAFDMKVSIAQRPNTTYPSEDTLRQPLDSLLPTADFVSLHCALSDDTHHLFDAKRLSLMRSSAFLINTARGALIDDIALLHLLKHNGIAGAAIDVVDYEPPRDSHPLFAVKSHNLLITPHVAWASRESRQRLVDMAADHLSNFLKEGYE